MIRISKPDITHVQYMAPGAIPILLLRLFGIKNIIATAHTAADIYPNLKLVHFIQRYCVRVFTCITQVAEMSFFGKFQSIHTKNSNTKGEPFHHLQCIALIYKDTRRTT